MEKVILDWGVSSPWATPTGGAATRSTGGRLDERGEERGTGPEQRDAWKSLEKETTHAEGALGR